MRRTKICIAALALLLMVSCAGTAPLYVAADRATFDAVAGEYLDYVKHDVSMHPQAKARRERTIATWDARISAAEGRPK